MNEKLARMRELTDILNRTAYEYYTLDAPTISDREWDALYRELEELEQETGEKLQDSPTRRVGGQVLSSFEPHTHLARLWSMNKAQTKAELRDWYERCARLLAEAGIPAVAPEICLEHKFDGLTVNLTYENGLLVTAATRGNGVTGEMILPQILTIPTIPLSVPCKDRFEIHGEAVMRISEFEKYNLTAKEPLKNPRNAAAGALRNLDPQVTASRHLSVFFYDVGYKEGAPFATQEEMLAFMKENRFPVSDYTRYTTDLDTAIEWIDGIGESRGELDYMIDGAVLKLTDFDSRASLGFTDKFPRWAIAYKFEAEEAVTTVRDITWQLGRTGKLTPLAHVDAVELAGATVRRATLNNYQDILRKHVRIGGQVYIRRSNEVIPEITGSLEEYSENDRPVEKPSVCPVCGTALIENGAHLFCPNKTGCRQQIIMRISHFAERDAMDIESLSEKTVGYLYDSDLIHEITDLYELDEKALSALEGFGEKRARNLIEALDKSRHPSLPAFIYALSIPNVGTKTASDLARKFGSFAGFAAAGREQLLSIDDIGETVADSILAFFADEKKRALVEGLLSHGVVPNEEVAQTGTAFEGMTVVVTGTLEHFGRSDAEKAIRDNGGKGAGSVSGKTSLVVAGTNAGSKLDKARQLGIRVIDEAEFMSMLGIEN